MFIPTIRQDSHQAELWEEGPGEQLICEEGDPEGSSEIKEEAEADDEDSRPKIDVTPNEREVNDEALAALTADPDIYQRNRQLVRIERNPNDAIPHMSEIGLSPQTPVVTTISRAILRERLSSSARFMKTERSKGGETRTPVHPPAWCVSALRDRGEYPGIKRLRGITECPILRPDGTILDTPRYDPQTELFYAPASELGLSIASEPSRSDAERARDQLTTLVDDFPFADANHCSAWIAALLTGFARWAYSGPAPLFLIDANVRGSGKTLLADLISFIHSGRSFARVTNPTNEEEARKRITALALGGIESVLIDNVVGTLGTGSLDAALTGETWQDRLLGANKIVTIPLNFLIIATGNNVVLGCDTARRVCHIRMQSSLENPEERSDFLISNIRDHVRDNRARYISAALTILRAYCVAGRPDMNLTPWGSFEQWSDLVRSAIVWAGLDDPGMGRMNLASTADSEATALRAIVAGFRELDPERSGLRCSDILQKLESEPQRYAEFRDALISLTSPPSSQLGTSQSVGNILMKFRDRVVNGFRLRSVLRSGSNRWSVEDIRPDNEGGTRGASGTSATAEIQTSSERRRG